MNRNTREVANSRRIHGLPPKKDFIPFISEPDYHLAVVPRSCTVIPESSSDEIIISASYNPLSIIAAIFQALYASITLYETRGDQLTRYGYAAFGLTVAPYLVMSIVNLFGSLATPTYDTMYLVRSKALGELECKSNRKPYFDGIVGKISEPDGKSTSRESFLSQQRFLRLMPRPEAVPTGSPCEAVHDNQESPAGVFFGIAFNSNFLMHASCIQS